MFIHELSKYYEDCTEGELRSVGYYTGGAMDAENAEEPLVDPREAVAEE